jgi:hypothetical protein
VLKSHNKWLVLGVALLILLTVSQIGIAADEPPITLFINPNPTPEFKADVWVDRGQGATYYPGDSIDVYYRSTKNSYVYILNIDAANRSRWLLPSQWFPNNYAMANRTYVLSNMQVEVPSGREYLVVFSSTEPLSLPYLEQSVRSGGETSYIEGEADLVFGAIQAKIRITPQRNWVSSNTYFYVGGGYTIPIRQPIQPVIPPAPRYAAVNVSTNPSRARVFLDGEDKGTSTVLIKNVPLGKHEITVVLPGYYTYTKKFEANHVQTYYINATLKLIK